MPSHLFVELCHKSRRFGRAKKAARCAREIEIPSERFSMIDAVLFLHLASMGAREAL
jgi:hypothetical protein